MIEENAEQRSDEPGVEAGEQDITTESDSSETPPDGAITWRAFLETTPPGVTLAIREIRVQQPGRFRSWKVYAPDNIFLYCGSDHCTGMRFFTRSSYRPPPELENDPVDFLLTYKCRNCEITEKRFAVHAWTEELYWGRAVKIGEYPPFGPQIPARLQRLVQQDRDLLMKGRRAESQGLGVGAFAYYRRIVEDNKDRFIDEIRRVAEKSKAPPELLQRLERARNMVQFSAAVEEIKDGVPEALLIEGHNQLTILHQALSQELHAGTDQECLELATSIRVVLTALADRTSRILKDEAELNQALKRILHRDK